MKRAAGRCRRPSRAGGHDGSEDFASSIGSRCSPVKKGVLDSEETSSPKVHCCFSIKAVEEMFSNMTGAKEDMLRQIGFSALMNLPKQTPGSNCCLNRQFALWLLRKVDAKKSVIDLGHRGQVPITPKDVHIVLGLPYEGEIIEPTTGEEQIKAKRFVKELLFLQESDKLTLDTVQRILLSEYREDMIPELRRCFIVAAVIFAVSYFLAPKGRPIKVNSEILPYLVDPVRIFRINWSEYVLRVLLEASQKVQKDDRSDPTYVTLDGCLLLLQVIYLDNLEFPRSKTNHFKLPRVGDFSYELLESLISMDTNKKTGDREHMFGHLELRHPYESVYSFGDTFRLNFGKLNARAGDTSVDSDFEAQCDMLGEVVTYYADQHKKAIRRNVMEFVDSICVSLDRQRDGIISSSRKWLRMRHCNMKSKERKRCAEKAGVSTKVQGDGYIDISDTCDSEEDVGGSEGGPDGQLLNKMKISGEPSVEQKGQGPVVTLRKWLGMSNCNMKSREGKRYPEKERTELQGGVYIDISDTIPDTKEPAEDVVPGTDMEGDTHDQMLRKMKISGEPSVEQNGQSTGLEPMDTDLKEVNRDCIAEDDPTVHVNLVCTLVPSNEQVNCNTTATSPAPLRIRGYRVKRCARRQRKDIASLREDGTDDFAAEEGHETIA